MNLPALSHATVTSTPASISSQLVSLAPCRRGRVSSAKTLIFFPVSTALYMTASAVPIPPVARAPALQWVSTFQPLRSNFPPCSPIALQSRWSSS
jgi:hypothetical protein